MGVITAPSCKVFRQNIKHNIVCVKDRLSVQILGRRRLDHDPLLPQGELIDIAVIGNIHAPQHIHSICIDRNPERNRIVKVICDIRPVNHELATVCFGMYHRGDALKPVHISQVDFVVKIIVSIAIDPVIDVIQPVDFVVDLEIAVGFAVYGNNAGKRRTR